jgi:truncated hemoglobin YjbI
MDTEAEAPRVTTLYEHAGGDAGLHRLEELFYSKVLADPLLQPLFGEGQAHHVEHLTMFTAESFGGPDRFTRELFRLDHVPLWDWGEPGSADGSG